MIARVIAPAVAPAMAPVIVSAIALLPVALAFVAPAHAQWRIEPRIGVSAAYTDNAFGANEGQEEGDFFITLSPGATVSKSGGRSTLRLTYTANHDEYADSESLSGTSHNLLAAGNVEVWREIGAIDANLALSRQVADELGPVATGNRSLGTNQTDVFNYRLSPVARLRFGQIANSESRLTLSGTAYNALGQDTVAQQGNQPSDSLTYRARQDFTGGLFFARLNWRLSADYAKTDRGDGSDDFTSRSTEARLDYVWNRAITVFSTVGYDQFNDGATSGGGGEDPDGVRLTLGTRLRPGPRTDLSFEFGRRFDDPYYNGNVSVRVFPTITLSGFYERRIETQQNTTDTLFENLSQNEFGEFIDDRTGLPALIGNNGLDLSQRDDVFRSDVFRAGLVGTRGRNTYRLSVFRNNRRTVRTGSDDRATGTNLGFSRRLSPVVTANLDGSYTDNNSAETSDSQTISVRGTLNYRIGVGLNGVVALSHLNREVDSGGQDLEENLVSVRLTKVF